ncbi:MAG: hypothetical protein NC548_25705 [Lachnospiraceae bacterium]|nr:hypothetical protein [Lachnospiraceae bacterium]
MDDIGKIIKEKFNSSIYQIPAEDRKFLFEVNLEKADSFVEVLNEIERLKNEEAIEVEIKVEGLDELKEAMGIINDAEKPLETALKAYKEQGYLTMDQVEALIEDYPEYARYIRKVGDEYVFVT